MIAPQVFYGPQDKRYRPIKGACLARSGQFGPHFESLLTIEVTGTFEGLVMLGLLEEIVVCPAEKLYVAVGDMSDGLTLKCDKDATPKHKMHRDTRGVEWS